MIKGRIMSLTKTSAEKTSAEKTSAEKIYIIAPLKRMTQDVGHICVKTS